MTFLNPIALLGLLAASIPLLLHIFNLRKLKTIEFSTLSFLKELQKTKMRRLKLRQLLLLVLRTLLVISIVLAFSRPTLKGSLAGSLAGQAKTTAVIILDDSQSMTASDEQGELLFQAKNAALGVLGLLKNGDEVFLLKLSDVTADGMPEIPPAQRNFPAVKNAVNEIKPSSIHRTIEDALRFTSRLLTTSKNFNKEVYIISDFQSGSFESKTRLTKMSESLFAPTAQFFLIPLGKRELQNVSIESVEIPNTILEVNRPFVVRAKLTNHGTSEVRNHVVSVYQERNRVGQKGVDIPAGRSVEVEFTVVPQHAGFIEGKVELEDDDLEFDNMRFYTVFIPAELHVLLVGTISDFTYLHTAITTRLSDSSSTVIINQINTDRFSSSQLNNTDVVVLSNAHEFSHDQSLVLKTYVQNGGGMLYFPGTQTSGNIFNTTLADPLGIATASPSEDIFPSNSGTSFIEFDKVDLRHPLFTGMFEETEVQQRAGASTRQRSLESPRINKSMHYFLTQKSRPIITLTNGFPFLIEEKIGNGNILLFSIAADTAWSDFPLKGLFVPLVHRSLIYLAQKSAIEHEGVAGEGATIHFRTTVSPKLKITKPDGKEIFINPNQFAVERSIRFFENDIPGIYSVTAGSIIADKFATNMDPDESNTAPTDQNRREGMFRRIGIADNSLHIVKQPQEVQQIITESRLGAELWKQFLVAALLIALIELFVAQMNKRYISSAKQNT